METPAARSAPVAGGDRGTELGAAPKLFPLPGPGCSVAAVRGESPPGGRGGAELRGLAGGDLPKVLPRAPAVKLYIGLPFLMLGAVAAAHVFIIQQLDLMPIIPRAEGRALSSKVKIKKKNKKSKVKQWKWAVCAPGAPAPGLRGS